MKEMNVFIKCTLSTILAYTTVAMLLFVYTDTSWIIRGLGIAACVIGDFVCKWTHYEELIGYWIKKLSEKK